MLLPGVAMAATYAKGQVWSPPQTKLAAVHPVPRASEPSTTARKSFPAPKTYQVPAVALPSAGTATASLPQAAAGERTAGGRAAAAVAPAAARVGSSPVWVAAATSGTAAPAKVQVRFVAPATARKAGFTSGLVFGIARNDASTAAGKVSVQLDPELLSGEGGGDLAQRMRLVELPACALTTPLVPACQTQTPVRATVDAASGRLVVTTPLASGTEVGASSATRMAADLAVSTRPGATSTAADTDVASPMTVLTALDAPAGSAGTYAATSIKASDDWSAGGSTGDFTYSYPITVPSTLGGSAPSVALSYASSAVDGETVAANAQVSDVGDGWSGMSTFIERSYQPCSQDGIANSSDTCWGYGGHEVSLSGGNLGGQMVWDDATSTWHISGSDATVKLETGGANGAYNGEYWVITTEDGTRMYYGAGKLPTAEGGTGSDVATNSVSTEPVYCPNSGDCDKAPTGSGVFTANMPYRWYLDFVVDPHGNATEYNYTQETNYYARGSAHTDTVYDRGAYLDSISYGWRASDIAAEGAKPAPAAKVVFTESTRCIVGSVVSVNSANVTVTAADCASLNSTSAPFWPDVPQDELCASTGSCANDAMTYFSEMRLTGISTYVNTGSTTSFTPTEVDSYVLAQTLPPPGDGTSPELQLNSITRTGDDGGSLPMPAVTFYYTPGMPNRVPGAASWPAMLHFRIAAIENETGGVTNVTYSSPDCNQSTSSPDLPTPSSDTRLCYEEYWTPADSTMISDWFEKYTVSQVEQTDSVGGSPPQITKYLYPPNGAAWHRNDSPLVPNAQRTWDQWRGYGQVITETGTAPDPITETETTYLRGMQGDFTNQTGTTTRTWPDVTDSIGGQVPDLPQYAGYTLETQTFNQAGGKVAKDDISLPWSATTATHAETATGIPTGVPPEQAYYVEPQTDIDRGLLSNGNWRTTETVSQYSPTTGLLTQTDNQGDTSLLNSAQSTETCSTVTYATPPATGLNAGMTGLVGESTTVSVTSGTGVGANACPAKTAANTVSDTRTFYDGDATPGVVPAGGVGNVTEVETLGPWSGSTETFTVKSTSPSGSTGFDVYGRQLSATDVRGDTVTDAYTSTNPGTLPNKTSVTNVTAGNWTTTTSLDQLRQLPTSLVDPNGNSTTESYDPLGRLTHVWLPGRSTSLSASKVFTYSLGGQTARTWTETQVLRASGSYSSEFDIYDGFMQLLQEQSTSLDSEASNGSNVTDHAYDSHGWEVKTSSTPYYISTAPSSTFYPTTDATVPGQTVTTYDGMGRTTGSAFYSLSQPQWSTTTAYPGVDETTTVPPAGGTATATFTDAQGRTTASWQYHGDAATGNVADATVTSYAYTTGTLPTGAVNAGSYDKVTTVTDASGHEWTQATDAQGNQVATTDPDAGSSTATYSPAGDLLTSTDGNGTVVSYAYDALGRKVAQYNTATQSTANQLATWTYDTAPGGKGQLASQSSYYNGNAYTQTTTGYNALGESTGLTTTIPSAAGNLANTYNVAYAYNAVTGAPYTTTYGADGGLPAETVSDTYTVTGDLENVTGSLNNGASSADYLTAAVDNPLGQVTRATVGDMPNQLVQTTNYDVDTDRITETFLDAENNSSSHLDDTSTYWNPAGQITAQNDVQDSGTNTDLQCYTYDGQGRLTAAWTDTAGVSSAAAPSVPNIGGCVSTTPSAATNGGPDPYWETYAYDPNGQSSGNRSTVTDYNTSGAVTSTQTYGYNTGVTGTTGQPDTLQTLNTTDGTGTTVSNATYKYNADGSTQNRTVTNAAGTTTSNQNYTYDPTGRTTGITDTAAGTASGYQYDASGNLLLQTDTIAGNTTTLLYLPDEQLTMNNSGGITALRYYDTGSGITIIRDNTGNLTYQTGTSQGTGTLTISDTLTGEDRRSFTPYGNTRGTTPTTWVDGRGFLDQPSDPATGLDLLGARDYDPATGHFLSRDPILEATDPNQLGGYTYAADNPVNGSDPNGLSYNGNGGDGGPCSTSNGGDCGGSGGNSSGAGGGGGGGGGNSTGSGGAGNSGGARTGTAAPGSLGFVGPLTPSQVHQRFITAIRDLSDPTISNQIAGEAQAVIASGYLPNGTESPQLVSAYAAIDAVYDAAAVHHPNPRPSCGWQCHFRIVGNLASDLSTGTGAVAVIFTLATPACGAAGGIGAAICGGVAEGAGMISTASAGIASLAYLAGGDTQDSESNGLAFGIGIVSGGLGAWPTRIGGKAFAGFMKGGMAGIIKDSGAAAAKADPRYASSGTNVVAGVGQGTLPTALGVIGFNTTPWVDQQTGLSWTW